jgi:DHA1 family inner membrane transport protein
MATDEPVVLPPPADAPAPLMSRLPRLTGSEWAILLVLATVQFTHVLDFVIMMPLGPKLQSDLKISPEDFSDRFSLIVSAYGFSAGIMGLLAARLLDRFDRKKLLLVLFAGFGLGTYLCAVAPDYGILVLGRAVAGGFAGIMGANVLTIVSDVFPETRRGTAMGVVMSSYSVANIIGIYVGLEIAEHFGWRAPFTVLALLCLPVLALAWYILPSLHRPARHREHQVSLREVILNRRHLRAYALSSSLIMGSWMVLPALAIYLVRNVHWPEAELRWVWLFGGLATLLTMTPTGWLADRHNKRTVFQVIGLVSIVPVLLVTNLPQTSAPVVLAVTTLFMVCTSIRWVPVMALIATAAVPHQRGAFMSVNASVQQLAMGIASKFSGLLLVEKIVIDDHGVAATKLVGYPFVGLLAAGSMILGFFLAARVRAAPKAASARPPHEAGEDALSVPPM